jgi:hypothetical protein
MGVKTGAKPRPEVLTSDLDDAVFAADFGTVVDGSGVRVYTDARTFFENTHPAADLRAISSTVFGRLASHESGGVLRLSTGFGGGKTHTLIALYHLAQNIADPAIGTDVLPAAGRPDRVTVVGIDAGKAGHPVFANHPEGVATHSLWGELFYRLGGPDALASLGATDNPHHSPTATQFRDAFPDGPVLILLDELVIYLGRLDAQGRGNLLGFVTTLCGVVAQRPQTILVVTDPASQAAFTAEAGQVQEATKDAMALSDVLGRTVADFDPVGAETARVIVRRLFGSVDQTAAQAASAQYLARYRALVDARIPLPTGTTSAEYAREIVDSYPFHPRLFKTARERLATLPQYNKSRGTLRLFARLIRTIWDSPNNPQLITAGDIDWTSNRIRLELLSRLQREPFNAAIDADVNKHAPHLDERTPSGGTGIAGIHQRVANALLFESLVGSPNDGLDDEEATLATFRLDDAGHEAAEALHALAATCWHIYPLANGRGFQFRIPANILKQIEERRVGISRADATARAQTEVVRYYKGAAFTLAAWPTGPRDVTDSARLKLALCETETIARQVIQFQDDTPGREQPRAFVNAIIAVAAEPSRLEQAIEHAQRFLAAEEVKRDRETSGDTDAIAQLKQPLLDLARRMCIAAARAFSRVLVKDTPTTDLDEAHTGGDGNILASYGGAGQSALRKYLGAKDLIFSQSDTLDPDFFVQLLRGATPVIGEASYTAKAVHERLLSAPEMRLVPNDDFVRRTIRNACLQGAIAVAFGRAGDVGSPAYDKAGRVDGPTANRRRTNDQLPGVLPLDDTVRIAVIDTDTASAWLAVTPRKPSDPGDGAGDNGIIDIDDVIPPPDDDHDDLAHVRATSLTATNWEDAVNAANERPLLRLTLTAYLPARAQATVAAMQPLNGEVTTVSTQVKGVSRSDGSIDLTLRDVKLNASFSPLQVARTLFVDLNPGGTYRASVTITFGESGRFGIADQLTDIAVRFQSTAVPEERIDVQATFAPIPEAQR